MLERIELGLLRSAGYAVENPYDAVEYFESAVAKFTGAPYAVAVDCATHAIELSLRYLKPDQSLKVPRHTYPSVAMLAPKLGLKLEWTDEKWEGMYRLNPYPVIDASLRLQEGMYVAGNMICLSFQQKKRLPLGRGGMILTDDPSAHAWLKRAVHDGRDARLPWKEHDIEIMGYHYYMTPEDAARGLLMLSQMQTDAGVSWSDLGGHSNYPDISKLSVFRV
jgi:dTDP-4-amino-4,6-dideoxygalactose transaminase